MNKYSGRVKFSVRVVPVPKARARVVSSGGRVWAFTPRKTEDFEREVRKEASRWFKEPLAGPLELEVVFFMPIPASWSSKKAHAARAGLLAHTKRPDADNLYKGVADALNGVVFLDDSQVVRAVIEKKYGTPSVEVSVRPWDGPGDVSEPHP